MILKKCPSCPLYPAGRDFHIRHSLGNSLASLSTSVSRETRWALTSVPSHFNNNHLACNHTALAPRALNHPASLRDHWSKATPPLSPSPLSPPFSGRVMIFCS